jgi:hypothetical protein
MSHEEGCARVRKTGNCSAPTWSAGAFCTDTAKFVYAVFPKILYVIITFGGSDRGQGEQYEHRIIPEQVNVNNRNPVAAGRFTDY